MLISACCGCGCPASFTDDFGTGPPYAPPQVYESGTGFSLTRETGQLDYVGSSLRGFAIYPVAAAPAANTEFWFEVKITDGGPDSGGILYAIPNIDSLPSSYQLEPSSPQVRFGLEGGDLILTHPGGTLNVGTPTLPDDLPLTLRVTLRDNGDWTTRISVAGGGFSGSVSSSPFDIRPGNAPFFLTSGTSLGVAAFGVYAAEDTSFDDVSTAACYACACSDNAGPTVRGTVTTERFGDGDVILVADRDILSPCEAANGDNAPLFEAINGRNRGGDVAALGLSAVSGAAFSCDTSLAPTVEWEDSDGLDDVGILYLGSGIPSLTCRICRWVREGGILVVVLDGGAESSTLANKFLAEMGSRSRFFDADCGELPELGCDDTTDSKGIPMDPNSGHSWLGGLSTAYHGGAMIAAGEEWAYRSTSASCPWDQPDTDCTAIPGTQLVLSVGLPDLTFQCCLRGEGFEFNGTTTITYGLCGTFAVHFRLFCSGGSWHLSVVVGETTQTFTVTVDDPFTEGAFSGTSTNICGSLAISGEITPGPPALCLLDIAETDILRLSLVVGGEAVSICLSATVNDDCTTSYSGSGEVDDPDCGLTTITALLECRESSPGAGDWAWALDLTTDAGLQTFAPSIDPDGSGTVSGTLTVCTGHDRVLAGDFAVCDSETTPFAGCCTDVAAFCCLSSLATQGAFDEQSAGACDLGCTASAGTMDVAFDDYQCSTDSTWFFGGASSVPTWHLIGNVPINDGANLASHKILVPCDGGTFTPYLLDPNNCLIPAGSGGAAWKTGHEMTCSSLAGTVVLGLPTDSCCELGLANYEIAIAGG